MSLCTSIFDIKTKNNLRMCFDISQTVYLENEINSVPNIRYINNDSITNNTPSNVFVGSKNYMTYQNLLTISS